MWQVLRTLFVQLPVTFVWWVWYVLFSDDPTPFDNARKRGRGEKR